MRSEILMIHDCKHGNHTAFLYYIERLLLLTFVGKHANRSNAHISTCLDGSMLLSSRASRRSIDQLSKNATTYVQPKAHRLIFHENRELGAHLLYHHYISCLSC